MYQREQLNFYHKIWKVENEYYLMRQDNCDDSNIFLIYKIQKMNPELLNLSPNNLDLVSSILSYGGAPNLIRIMKTINIYKKNKLLK